MANIVFRVDAQTAQAFSAFTKLVEKQKESERAFNTMAQAGSRAERAQVSALGKMVQGVQARTRAGQDLSIGATGRAAFRAGGTSAFVRNAEEISFLRWQAAKRWRDATFSRNENLRRSAQGIRNLSGMDALLARGQGALDAHAIRRNLESDIAVLRADARIQEQLAQIARRKQFFGTVGDPMGKAMRIIGTASTAGFALNRYGQVYENLGDQLLASEDQFRPLYGVGDNTSKRALIRSDVLATAAGHGIDPALIAGARFSLQSAASDLPKDVQQAIEQSTIKLYKLQGSDMSATGSALVAAIQLLKDEVAPGVRGVRELENKLAYAADVGAFEIDQFAPYQSMILAAFKGMGFKHEDAYAASAVASKSGQRPEAWGTAVRNLPLLMSEAQKKLGRPLSQDFGTAMQEVAQLKSPELLDLVGRDTFVAAKILAEKNDLLRQYTSELEKITGKMDLIGRKLEVAWSDPVHANTEIIGTAKQLTANAPAIMAGQMGEAITDYELRRLGAKVSYGPLQQAIWTDEIAAAGEHLLGNVISWFGGPRGGMFHQKGVMHAINAARDAKDPIKAGFIRLTFGANGGDAWYPNREGRRLYTGEKEATEWLNLRQKNPDFSDAEYLEYKRMQQWSQIDADKYLMRVGGAAPAATPGQVPTTPTTKPTTAPAPALSDKVASDLAAAAKNMNGAATLIIEKLGGPRPVGNRHTE